MEQIRADKNCIYLPISCVGKRIHFKNLNEGWTGQAKGAAVENPSGGAWVNHGGQINSKDSFEVYLADNTVIGIIEGK